MILRAGRLPATAIGVAEVGFLFQAPAGERQTFDRGDSDPAAALADKPGPGDDAVGRAPRLSQLPSGCAMASSCLRAK